MAYRSTRRPTYRRRGTVGRRRVRSSRRHSSRSSRKLRPGRIGYRL